MFLGFGDTPTSPFPSDTSLHRIPVLFHLTVTFRFYLICRISHPVIVSLTKEGIIYFVCVSAPILNSAISNSAINTVVALKMFIQRKLEGSRGRSP